MGNTNDEIRLRSCQYDPTQDRIPLTDEITGEPILYLEADSRIIWFQTYCQERELKGYIDASQYRFIPELNMFIVTANVYINDKLVGSDVAGVMVAPGDIAGSGKALQTASTYAKGRALMNAGFGLKAIRRPQASGDNFPDGDEFPEQGVTVNPENPFDAVITHPQQPQASNPTPASAVGAGQRIMGQGTPAASNGTNCTNPPTMQEMTLDQAQAVKVPVGKAKGKTLGEVFATDPGMVKFWAGDRFTNATKYPELVAASTVILKAFNVM